MRGHLSRFAGRYLGLRHNRPGCVVLADVHLGTFTYFCGFHPILMGTAKVVVQP